MTSYPDRSDVAVRIIKLRRHFGITQKTLAERMNVNVRHISNIETRNTTVGYMTLAKLAKAMRGSNIHWVVLGEGPMILGGYE